MFGCKSPIHILDTLREKPNPKTIDCIFLEYVEGVKARVFKHVATSHRFVPRDAIVRSVRLNSKPIARLFLWYQCKRGTAEVSLEQPEEDQHKPKLQSSMTGENSTISQEDNNKQLVEWKKTTTRSR